MCQETHKTRHRDEQIQSEKMKCASLKWKISANGTKTMSIITLKGHKITTIRQLFLFLGFYLKYQPEDED